MNRRIGELCKRGHDCNLPNAVTKANKCRQCFRDYSKVYYKKALQRAYKHRRSWQSKGINLSLEEYNKKLDAQNNSCAICLKSQEHFQQRFAVDHNHKTGQIRGLLCSYCNIFIVGNFETNPQRMRNAVSYLETWSNNVRVGN